jgi:hypothetical protein
MKIILFLIDASATMMALRDNEKSLKYLLQAKIYHSPSGRWCVTTIQPRWDAHNKSIKHINTDKTNDQTFLDCENNDLIPDGAL